MHKPLSENANILPELTNDEVAEIVRQQLPHWQAACGQLGADTVILQQMAFGKTRQEMFLMGVAIRYAGIAGKHVTVIPYSPSVGG